MGSLVTRETSRHAPHHPFDENNHQLGPGARSRKVSHVHRVEVKQALVGQGRYREQENSHLEWPGHTLHPYRPCTTLTILVHPSFTISLGSGMQRGTAARYHEYSTDSSSRSVSRVRGLGTSLVVQGLRLCAPKAGGPGSIPRQGTRSCLPQLKDLPTKIPHRTPKIPRAATKTRSSQVNK